MSFGVVGSIFLHHLPGSSPLEGFLRQRTAEFLRCETLRYALEVFRAVMETNFFGALRGTQAVLPGMRERRNGCTINVTSVAGRLSTAPQSPFAASKWALEALSESLAQEVKVFGIRVAMVEPGVIATPIFGKVGDEDATTNYPHKRRIMGLFRASLENPVSPYVVGEKVRDIVDSGTWQLRHPPWGRTQQDCWPGARQ